MTTAVRLRLNVSSTCNPSSCSKALRSTTADTMDVIKHTTLDPGPSTFPSHFCNELATTFDIDSYHGYTLQQCTIEICTGASKEEVITQSQFCHSYA
eukprot:jgi/Phyca11/550667/estExt2_Genewise1Plus.C_PHYCAscaffold_380133